MSQTFQPQDYPVITQTFLQILINNRCMLRSQASAALAQINRTYLTGLGYSDIDTNPAAEPVRFAISPQICEQHLVDDVVEHLNHDLGDYSLAIKPTRDQVSGDRYISFINMHPSIGTKVATTLTPAEIDHFRNVIHKLFSQKAFEKNTFSVDLADIRDAYPKDARNQTNITTTQALARIQSLVDLGWFVVVPLSLRTVDSPKLYSYTLSTRALAELETYIKSSFGAPNEDEVASLRLCDQCKQIWTLGYTCSTPDCGMRYHGYCYENFVNLTKPTSCKECNAPMNYDTVGL